MQTAHRANIHRQRQIILHEVHVDPFSHKATSVPSLAKKPRSSVNLRGVITLQLSIVNILTRNNIFICVTDIENKRQKLWRTRILNRNKIQVAKRPHFAQVTHVI